jgi:beta-lactamase class A
MHHVTRGRLLLSRLMIGIVLAFSLAAMAPGVSTHAKPITPEAALVRLVTATQIQAGWFAPAFLAQVSVAQIEQARASLLAELGAYEGIQPQPDGSFLLRFQRGTDLAQIALDAQGRIIGLFFKPPALLHLSVAAALQPFKKLPGKVSVLVLSGGVSKGALNADLPLGVGSAFKLAVLAALERQVRAGQRSWSQVVTLKQAYKSLPSGILQTWPAGSHLTLETLASLMISQSDNTAADTLIHVVGRVAIDPLIPAADRPILTTHALFVLKDPAHAALRAAYLRGNQAQRLAAITQAEALPLPSPSLFGGGPVAPNVEWFFSARQLCGLMQQVHTLPLMGINPGIANPSDWRSVAFKGGSEPGVLNLTTMVAARDGTLSCVAATWNNTSALNEGQFEGYYGALLATLR